MELKGKNVFLTGGAQGIGLAGVEAVLAKGAKVFFVDKDVKTGTASAQKLASRFGEGNVKFAPLDVSDHQKFTEVFQQAVKEFGHIDIMINNAGLAREINWPLTIQVNLMALIHGTYTAQEHMRKDKGGKGGRVLNVISETSLMIFPDIPAYCASKNGGRAFTSCLAQNQNREKMGIEYCSLCPGVTNTSLGEGLIDDGFIPNKEVLEQIKAGRPSMEPARLGEAMVELLELKNMNDAILNVQPGKPYEYVVMEYKVVPKPE